MALTLPYPSMNFVPLDILTAAEQNQLVANIEYIANQFPITSSNIDWTTMAYISCIAGGNTQNGRLNLVAQVANGITVSDNKLSVANSGVYLISLSVASYTTIPVTISIRKNGVEVSGVNLRTLYQPSSTEALLSLQSGSYVEFVCPDGNFNAYGYSSVVMRRIG